MDFHQIITKGVCPGQVQIREPTGIPETGQILKISLSLHILHEDKRLLHFSEGEKLSVLLKCPYIQGLNMARKTIIGPVAPQKDLGSVCHVFVSKRAWTDGLQHSPVALPGNLVFYPDRNTVPISLEGT
jgi:hypothetical protein